MGTSTILITHNLGVVAEFTRRVMVMYLGKAVESGSVFDLFDHPAHPYTQALLNAVPKMGMRSKGGKRRLEEIKGSIPNPLNMPEGCKFHPRCPEGKRDLPGKRTGIAGNRKGPLCKVLDLNYG